MAAWRSQGIIVAGGLCALLSAVLCWAAFPRVGIPEAAYVFAVPVLAWCLLAAPRAKTVLLLGECVAILAWLTLLAWLRHVTVVGWIALSVVLAQFLAGWLYLAYFTLSRVLVEGLGLRVAAAGSLAGAWCVLEWVRGWLCSGFPWLPLAASQWERPVMLQVIAWTGSYGLSFVLIFFNVAFTLYISRWWIRRCEKKTPERSLELYAAILLVLGCLMFFFVSVNEQSFVGKRSFRVGIVQPYVPANMKWVAEEAQMNWETLDRLSAWIAPMSVDVILWPESATPLPVKGPYPMQQWVEGLSDALDTPILMGNMALEGGVWYNGLFLVNPISGLDEAYYVKRKLVPFGEYVPFRRWLPGVEKVVPIGEDFVPGTGVALLEVPSREGDVLVGGLVCYEDVFAALARESAQAGAECFVVVTNDAWYGEESAAYQHAAHSVLRAVETRRPVIRCGNGGWSGWIDPYGYVRQVLEDEKGSIYFRGAEALDVWVPSSASLLDSPYVRWGDYFVLLSLGLCLFFWPIARL